MTSTETALIYADGGSRGNPGPSGCGVAIKNAQDNSIIAALSQIAHVRHEQNRDADRLANEAMAQETP